MSISLSKQDRRALIRFAQELIHLPSPSTQEGAVALRLAEEMRAVGIAHVWTDEMGNVIGRIGGGQGPVLCYNGHMDTVRVTDKHLWSHDPYGAEIENGVLYGLGAADMKSALAAMVYGAKALLEHEGPLPGTLYLVGVVQEEPCEGLAMRAIMEEQGLAPDYVVLGEATNLQLARGQRGRLGMRIQTHGRSAHASAPERGRNAIYEASKVVVAIELLSQQMSRDATLGPGTIAVTDIHSTASSLNAIPDRCELYIDRRLTIGETQVKALSEIKRALGRANIQADVTITEYAATSYTGQPCRAPELFPAWLLPDKAPLIQIASRTIEETLGYTPTVGHWAFSTDGVYTAGVAGIPTIGFGPGEERYAHAVDEQVRIVDVERAATVYANLANRLLRRNNV